MRVVIDRGNGEQLYFVTNLDDHTTVGALLEAAYCDLREWPKAWIDGTECALDSVCVSVPIVEGSVIANAAPPATDDGAWCLKVIAGPDATTVYQLPREGTLRLGRADGADICVDSVTVSWSHALISVSDDGVWIRDDNSSNGTWVNGNRLENDSDSVKLDSGDVVEVGGVALRLHATEKVSHALPTGNGVARMVVAYNRPPRPALPEAPDPVELAVKKESQKPAKFSWIAVAAPLVMAVAMVAVMGSARYALIACLSPVMAVGSWFEQKRRTKASEKETEEEYGKDLKRLANDIQDAASIERERLQACCPYPCELIDTASEGGASLWQVRADDEDFWYVSLGVASRPWKVPISENVKPQERTREVIDNAELLVAPVDVHLSEGPLGVWGLREHCLAITRSITCQLATNTGPADTTIVVLSSKANADQFNWAHWLPHTMMGGANPNNRWISTSAKEGQAMARVLLEQIRAGAGTNLFVIVDELSLLQGQDAPTRDLLNFKPAQSYNHRAPIVSGIVIADNPRLLPASCYTVVEAKLDSGAGLTIPSQAETINHVTTCGIDLLSASKWARMLARFEDPEVSHSGGTLPTLVHLFDLLGFERETLTAEKVVQSWDSNSGFRVPLGLVADGVFTYDLVKEGPHGLVGGTTGSGKSELLRSLVAGLAARVSPDELTFILVDFKGGAAFASLDQLPHTIGTLSNLEASLAYRAIRALEAEMAYRQECFAKAGEGVDNLDAYLATSPNQPMPRLLVVVDEFAQLAKQYPDVLSSLVSIGAVGRTLGVHMILATQRPAGVVNDDILANTNMRTALRVQSREDSTNVISVPDASKIGREQKGRAYIKLGEDDISVLQTALVTGRSGQQTSTSLHADPILLGAPPPEYQPMRTNDEASDMDLLIEAVKEAAVQRGVASPRPVWPNPLPSCLPLGLSSCELDTSGGEQVIAVKRGRQVQVALADDPDHQRQYSTGWDLDDGNLLLVGIPGSGTTTTLVSLALSLAATRSPDECDLLLLDLGHRGLHVLNDLPHGRGYAGPGSANREIQTRLMRYAIGELERRSSILSHHKDLFIFVDGLASLREEYDDYDGVELLKAFYQVWVKGPAVGIYCVAASASLRSIPSVISEVTTQTWAFRLADTYDYSLIGIKADNIPASVPGRYVDSASGHHCHVATVTNLEEGIATIRRQWQVDPCPDLIRLLPERVSPSQIAASGSIVGSRWLIPVGVKETDLAPAVVEVYPGEHMLIAGPARSGKTSVLAGIAQVLAEIARTEGQDLHIVGLASPRSWLGEAGVGTIVSHGEASSILASCLVATTPTVLLIDDAHLFSDPDSQVASLLAQANPNVVVIAAGRNDDLRSQYGQWTNTLRKSRLGILLQPDRDRDGELMGIMVPRKAPVRISPGRGYACQSGSIDLIQSVTLDLGGQA